MTPVQKAFALASQVHDAALSGGGGRCRGAGPARVGAGVSDQRDGGQSGSGEGGNAGGPPWYRRYSIRDAAPPGQRRGGGACSRRGRGLWDRRRIGAYGG